MYTVTSSWQPDIGGHGHHMAYELHAPTSINTKYQYQGSSEISPRYEAFLKLPASDQAKLFSEPAKRDYQAWKQTKDIEKLRSAVKDMKIASGYNKWEKSTYKSYKKELDQVGGIKGFIYQSVKWASKKIKGKT